MAKLRGKNKAVFIDRDGTVIHERNYLSKLKDIKIFSGAVKGLKLLRESGFKTILVTNQSAIARGYLTEKKLRKIHARLQELLKRKGVAFDGIYYCRHLPGDGCLCRKPGTGMVKAAARRFKIDLKKSFTIGDHVNDFLLGKNMGGKAVFLLTGHGREEFGKIKKTGKRPDSIEPNFLKGVKWILGQE
ncbi:MAG: HAD family hydrolase [Elusimicrobiota bacterium]